MDKSPQHVGAALGFGK